MNESYEASLKAALSGALSGALLGGGSKFFSGAKKASELGKAGLIGAGLGGAITGGSTLAGSAIMGPPTQGEANPYTYRSGLGGALVGGAGGAGLGALLASGKLRGLAKSPGWVSSIMEKIRKSVPVENMLTRKLAQYGMSPTSEKIKKGALIGGLAGGLPASFLAADEGMGVDVLMRELEKRKRKQYLERIMSNGY